MYMYYTLSIQSFQLVYFSVEFTHLEDLQLEKSALKLELTVKCKRFNDGSPGYFHIFYF